MATLERLELIYQPYNSAGRLPTTKGLRAFVNYMMQQTPDYFLEAKNTEYSTSNIRELADFIYTLASKLAEKTGEIAFFIVPEKHICEFNGIAAFLEKNTGKLSDDGMNIIKMLEKKPSFTQFIANFPLRE